MYKLLKYIVTIISVIIEVIASLYGAYILFTPGFYLLFVVYVIVCIISISGAVWFKHKCDDKQQESDRESVIENMYGMTYRKRYYCKPYILSVMAVYAVSLCLVLTLFTKQATYPSNYEFSTKVCDFIDYEVEDDKNNVLYKFSICIPNSIKSSLVELIDILDELGNVVEGIDEEDLKDEDNLNKFREYVESVEERVEIAKKNLDYMKIDVFILCISVAVLKISRRELKHILDHRSISL